MVFILFIVLAAMALSTRVVRLAAPFESLLAIGACGVLAVLLFQIGRLA